MALTVRQPWAWAIVHAHKDVENRTRNVVGSYRGTVAIHAGKTPDPDGFPAVTRITDLDGWWMNTTTPAPYVAGAVIATCEILGVHRHEPGCCESPWAMPGQWHIYLALPIALPEPVPCRGALGLWRLDDDTSAAVAQQVQAASPF